MFTASAFTRDFDLSNFSDSENYLTVNCAGYYKDISGNDMCCMRPNGRADYMIMYCTEGSECILVDNKEIELGEGEMCIYTPYEPQYIHYNLNHSNVYWVHFTGYGCDDLLKQCLVYDKQIFYIGKNSEIESIFTRLVSEIMLKRVDYEKICSNLLSYCLFLMGRSLKESNKGLEDDTAEKLNSIIAYINSNYNKRITIDQLAETTHSSKYTLIRQFKQFYGQTPVDYLIHVRVQRAKELLERTNISIKTVSLEVGYDNPFYFSRMFKKITGISPEKYKNKIAAVQNTPSNFNKTLS